MSLLFCRQWRTYTCVPAVFRFVTHNLTLSRYTEREAMLLLGTTQEGTETKDLARALIREGLNVIRHRTITEDRINNSLRKGNMMAVADDNTWRHPHIITIIGEWNDRYKIVDPTWGFPTWRKKAHVVKSANDEGLTIN